MDNELRYNRREATLNVVGDYGTDRVPGIIHVDHIVYKGPSGKKVENNQYFFIPSTDEDILRIAVRGSQKVKIESHNADAGLVLTVSQEDLDNLQLTEDKKLAREECVLK